MNHETHSDEQQPKQPQTPYEYLALFPGAPTQIQLEELKQRVPGGRLRLLPMRDGKRLFLLRGFSALEQAEVEAALERIPVEKRLYQQQVLIALKCTIWNSVTADHKLKDTDLASFGAGLAPTLFTAIADLSDFTDPMALEQLFVDL